MAKASAKNKAQVKVEKPKKYFDYNLLFITVFLCVFGLIMIYSAGTYSDEGAKASLVKQASIIIGSAVLTVGVMKLPFNVWNRFSFHIYIFSLLLILLVKSPLGHTSHGATRWLYLGPLSIQPAEIAKLAIIMYVATILYKCRNKMNDYKVAVLVFAPAVFVFAMILLLTRNLSSAIIVLMIAVMMYFTVHPNWKVFLILAVLGVLVIALFVIYVNSIDVSNMNLDDLNNFRLSRIIAWLHPEEFSDNQSMQTLNALYAIGSGGLFGKGLGSSIQKAILPEVQNDMIFAIICEELGLFGAFVLILLFILLLYRIIFIARNTLNTYGGLIAIGVFSQFAIQIILNIGVTTNVFPNTGVTLPFISYGGSAVAILIFEVGLVLKASRYIPTR